MTKTFSLQLESSAALTHMMDQNEEMHQLKDTLVLFCVQRRLLRSLHVKEELPSFLSCCSSKICGLSVAYSYLQENKIGQEWTRDPAEHEA